jgi:hypothetical protein
VKEWSRDPRRSPQVKSRVSKRPKAHSSRQLIPSSKELTASSQTTLWACGGSGVKVEPHIIVSLSHLMYQTLGKAGRVAMATRITTAIGSHLGLDRKPQETGNDNLGASQLARGQARCKATLGAREQQQWEEKGPNLILHCWGSAPVPVASLPIPTPTPLNDLQWVPEMCSPAQSPASPRLPPERPALSHTSSVPGGWISVHSHICF